MWVYITCNIFITNNISKQILCLLTLKDLYFFICIVCSRFLYSTYHSTKEHRLALGSKTLNRANLLNEATFLSDVSFLLFLALSLFLSSFLSATIVGLMPRTSLELTSLVWFQAHTYTVKWTGHTHLAKTHALLPTFEKCCVRSI